MKIRQKLIEKEAWRNLAPDEEAYEPIPLWVVEATEVNATAGSTFMVKTAHGPAVCYVTDYVIKGPTDTYPCTTEAFEKAYEIIEEKKA